jgi:O-antigen ligase
MIILVLTVALGTSALHTLMTHFAPGLNQLVVLMWLLMYVAAFLGLMFNHGINWISWMARYRILLVVLLLGTTLSVAWSLDAAASAERVVHLMGCSILAIYLGFMVPLLTTLRATAIVLAVIMVASIAAAMGMPSVGMQEYEGKVVWSGILNSKNHLGFWASIAVLLYIALSNSCSTAFMKLVCYAMALISLYVLIKSESATSLLAMLVAGALSLYIFLAFRFQLGFVRMAVLALLLGGLLGFAVSFIDTAEIVGRSGDLTGRGEVWRQTWKLIMEKPLTGYGYGAIWFPTDATLWIQQSLTDFTWVVYHAHNGFLQVASEIGLPLAVIALLMVAQQLIEILYCQYERQQVGVLFALAFVVAYLISNFSEARFLVNRELYWIFFLALPISMLRQINLVSLDDAVTDSPNAFSPGGNNGAVPVDKPWLNPNPPRGAGAYQYGLGAAAASATAYPRLTLNDSTDIDVGSIIDYEDSYDLGSVNLTESGDHTLDNTQSASEIASAGAMQAGENEQHDGAIHDTSRRAETDADPSADPSADMIAEENTADTAESMTLNDTDVHGDRYDKHLGSSDQGDDDEDNLDITLDDIID